MLLIRFVAAVQLSKIIYLLHYPNFSSARNTSLNEVGSIDRRVIDQHEIKIILIFPLTIFNLFVQ